MTLRSVTEGQGNQGQPGQPGRNKQPQPQSNAKNSSNGVVKSIPPSIASNNSPNSGGKRTSRTPIIIISAGEWFKPHPTPGFFIQNIHSKSKIEGM